MKALGTGHSQGVLWRDVEIVRRGGPPAAAVARRRRPPFRRDRRPFARLVTITHSDALAFAQVLILGGADRNARRPFRTGIERRPRVALRAAMP